MAIYTVSISQGGAGTVSVGDGTLLANLSVSAGRGPKGDGFTGGSYNGSTGVVTFTSNDGLGFATGDLRGNLTDVDITGGTIDGTVIGGSTPAAISGTTGQFGTSLNVDGTVTADGLVVDGNITSTGGDLNLATLDLNAIAASKAVTAVDVFVYDTSRDSDGGAWRKRTQYTSWYNETLNTATRGARREFPAVAVIVAESNKVTIFDGDDPALPMWMVFNAGAASRWPSGDATGAFFVNGVLAISTTARLLQLDFLSDVGLYYRETKQTWDQPLVSRNTAGSVIVSAAGSGIVNTTTNDVAMTVLPDAPIDPATGLPVPTIAVATNGGVSVIKDDGTVVDSSQAFAIRSVAFRDNGSVLYRRTGSPEIYAATTYAADGFGVRVYDFDLQPYSLLFGSSGSGFSSSGSNLFVGRNVGLETYLENTSALTTGMVAYTTSTYNTGWMAGDIKGAFLSDTDDTDLVGSGELVTNGTFDTDTNWTKGTGWTISGGVATSATATAGSLTQPINLVAGRTYQVQYEITAYTSGSVIPIFIGGTSVIGTSGSGTGVKNAYITAGVGNNQLSLSKTGSADSYSIDNVSVQLADADRSVNNNGLIVNGTVTRTPVATGADLVAYSGFSASNYLEQPYNSALDFGTGDFSVMGWFKLNGLVTDVLISRKRVAPNRFIIQTSAGALQYLSSSVSLTTSQTFGDNMFRQFAAVRNNGTTTIYVNGVALLSGADAGDVNSGNPLFVGINENLGSALAGSLALLRISATAPTAEQIYKIYNDEKFLFQDNAQATLFGASDAVTALAHDPVTDLLHVGTSAGRSVFSGLRRVSNTTTAVGTAISAVNDLVVEE
jgi:hypothetical protein